ncbi:transglycosylase family protein [Promicromonospora sp. NPDC023987]|uniref:transglycosylase family protein n=1 Tax=Promicromonospora sp. NPDC023987 TaxID=3155360 RepID=UPI0033F280A3
MTFPHPAQGSPSDSLINPEVDGDVGITEFFGPPPPADEVFPAAMFAAAGTEAGALSDVMASLPPGHPSGPMPVVPVGDGGVLTAPPPPPPPPPPEPEPPRRRRRAALLASFAVVAVAGTGGVAAYGAAHKTVTLDVDGKVTTVETFQGDVVGLLADEGVEVAGRDAVTPGLDGALREGGTVVVRYGHKVTLRADGERRTAWVTALDADEALAKLSRDAGDVVLIPARAKGSVTLPMRLDADGPVDLVAGGETQRVADGDAKLPELLAEAGVSVDRDDRVFVERGQADGPDGPALTVVVQEVQSSIEETASDLPFETVTATDPDHYEDLGPYLATDGAVGKRVTSWDVTKIDGKVVDREKLNSWVARAPVDKVIMYGSKARPAPEPEPEPKSTSEPDAKAEPEPDSKSDSRSRSEGGKTAAEPKREPEARTMSASAGGVWADLAECESGGDPGADTGNGYYGLYQFSQPTWEAMGGSGLPSEASAAEQTMRARALQQQSGWGQWPACSSALGLR